MTLLQKHEKIFNDKPGRSKIGMHEIKLKPNYTSKHKAPYLILEKLRVEVDKQIPYLLQQGLIEPSQSPFASPIVCVAKSYSSIRMCCDYRDLNSRTIDYVLPMKNMQDMLMKVGNCNYISCLDCSQGFYQIPMHPNSIEMTAFITHSGHFQWRVMSFGLKNASNSFQNVMIIILQPHSAYADAFIDDIVISSKIFNDHLKHLDAILTDLEENNITLKLKKCKFA